MRFAVLAPRRRARTLLAALGVLAAAIVVGTAATLGFGLATGFGRAADDADLAHVIARFDEESRERVDPRVRALPNVVARSYRYEIRDVGLRAEGHATGKALLELVLGGRRGYGITAGRDVRAPGEAVIERGLARDWDLGPGDRIVVGGRFPLRVVGVGLEPDNVAFPLTVTPRVYALPRDDPASLPVNVALLWLADPDRADVTLTQARATSFGIGGLAFVTRAGVEVLLDQAAGLIIALLVAFSLVALIAAGTMLAAGAQADVQRRLPALGVQRALGFTPGRLAARYAGEAALVALPAALLGLAIGALAVSGPAADLLTQLNEQPPGAALLPVLAACLLAIVGVVTVAAGRPAWRAARRPPAEILRGGDLAPDRRARRGSGDAGLLGTGARFAVAARGRFLASVATIAACAGVVLLMLALASLLVRLRDDPETVGKRYQLTVRLNPFEVDAVKRIPGVADASERYQSDVADAYRLGEPLRIVAYPGDHTRFEAPPLAEGRRLRGDGEAEVGVGLADALGLRPGATLAVQGQGGDEARFRVVGVVRALERDGRIAYVRPRRLLAAQPDAGSSIAVKLAPGADRGAVERDLEALGAPPQAATAATSRNAALLGVLATVLRAVGLAIGLVCLYALAQALAMTARERRGAIALLRASGADATTIALVLAGAALAVAVPAAIAGVLLEWLVLGPLVARLAAGYADLPLAPAPGQALLVAGGLLAARRGRDGAGRPPRDARADPRGTAGGVMARAAAVLLLVAALLAGCGGDEPPAPADSTVDATLVDRNRDGALEPGPGEPLGRPHRARAGRAAGRGPRHARPDHRRARARRGVAGARPVPRPLRRPVRVHVPAPGGAQHAGAHRRRARRRRAGARRGLRDRRPDRLGGVGRARPGAGGPRRRPRRPGHRRAGLRRRPGAGAAGPVLLPARPRRAAPPGAARRGGAAVPSRPDCARRGTRRSATTTCSSRARPRRPPSSTRSPPARGWWSRSPRGAEPDPDADPATQVDALLGSSPSIRVPADPRRRHLRPAEEIARLTTRDAAPDRAPCRRGARHARLRRRPRRPRPRARPRHRRPRAAARAGSCGPRRSPGCATSSRGSAVARCSSSPTTRSTTRSAATRRSPRSTPPRAWSR